MTYVYILLLEEGYWYIGITNRIKRRFLKHFTEKGSAFTRKHPPIAIAGIIPQGTSALEDKVTLIYMAKFGFEKVTGGIWAEKGYHGKYGRLLALRKAKEELKKI